MTRPLYPLSRRWNHQSSRRHLPPSATGVLTAEDTNMRLKDQGKIGTYPLADWPSREDCEQMDLRRSEVSGPLPSLDTGVQVRGHRGDEIRAIPTGEKHPPKQGEWYLSGARVAAYRAPNDLSTAYHIAKLVRTHTETVTTMYLRPVS